MRSAEQVKDEQALRKIEAEEAQRQQAVRTLEQNDRAVIQAATEALNNATTEFYSLQRLHQEQYLALCAQNNAGNGSEMTRAQAQVCTARLQLEQATAKLKQIDVVIEKANATHTAHHLLSHHKSGLFYAQATGLQAQLSNLPLGLVRDRLTDLRSEKWKLFSAFSGSYDTSYNSFKSGWPSTQEQTYFAMRNVQSELSVAESALKKCEAEALKAQQEAARVAEAKRQAELQRQAEAARIAEAARLAAQRFAQEEMLKIQQQEAERVSLAKNESALRSDLLTSEGSEIQNLMMIIVNMLEAVKAFERTALSDNEVTSRQVLIGNEHIEIAELMHVVAKLFEVAIVSETTRKADERSALCAIENHSRRDLLTNESDEISNLIIAGDAMLEAAKLAQLNRQAAERAALSADEMNARLRLLENVNDAALPLQVSAEQIREEARMVSQYVVVERGMFSAADTVPAEQQPKSGLLGLGKFGL